MARTVNEGFNILNKDFVNLDPDRTRVAIGSRDWLWEQLNGLNSKVEDFPQKLKERHFNFGSFARKTKIRELDDIDLMFALHADNAHYSKDIYRPNTYYILTTNAGQN